MFDSHFLFGSKDCLWSSLASVMLCFCTEVSELLCWRHTSLASYCLIRWDSSKLFKFLLCIKPSSTKILFFDCHTRSACSKGMRLFFNAHTIGTQSILRCCNSISGSFLFSCQSCRAEILFLLCQPRALSLIYNWLRDNWSLSSISLLFLLGCKSSHTFCRSSWLLWPSCK